MALQPLGGHVPEQLAIMPARAALDEGADQILRRRPRGVVVTHDVPGPHVAITSTARQTSTHAQISQP
jgi:hypothetical protein